MLGLLDKPLPFQKILDSIIAYGLIIVPIVVFLLLVNKHRLRELYPTGLFIAGIAMYHDTIGEALNLWHFPGNLFLADEDIFLPLDLILLPIEGMLLIQFLPKDWWKQNLYIGLVSLLNSLGELFVKKYTNLYHPHPKWITVYSFVAFLLLFWTARGLYFWYAEKPKVQEFRKSIQ